MSGTYGLLVTSDRGASWRHVCETAYGERDLSVDALVALTPDGTLLAGIYSGVSRAAGDPCGFERTLGRSNREAVPDFALAQSKPGHVVAALATLLEDGTSTNQLYRSEDDGRSWSAVGRALPGELRVVLTLDVAPTDEQRVYVSGLGKLGEGVLLRSDDGGESFEALAIPTDAALAELPFIAAVDPENPDALYVRTDLWAYDDETGVARANDALLYSEDGGTSFSELKRAGGKLFGFALSPDATEVLIGYGDPLEAGRARILDPEALGIYRATKGSAEFSKLYAGSIGCLTWTTAGIYACTHEVHTGFSLGLSATADFSLEAPPRFEPLLRLRNVAGPIECAACTAGASCASYWLSTCQSWGRDDCEQLEPNTCSQTGGAGGSAGAADAGESQATGGSRSSAGSPSPGCSCTAADEAHPWARGFCSVCSRALGTCEPRDIGAPTLRFEDGRRRSLALRGPVLAFPPRLRRRQAGGTRQRHNGGDRVPGRLRHFRRRHVPASVAGRPQHQADGS